MVLDVEGTTTPITFVTQVLFPDARAHVADFLRKSAGQPEVRADVKLLRKEHAMESAANAGLPPWNHTAALESAVVFVYWLMDRDRKSAALKSLQGKIWEAGYRSGALRGEVYPDVGPAFARWRRQGRDIAIFSSGSVLAQRLLFAHSTAGDLTPFIRDYFDLSTGPKRESHSYARIAARLGRSPEAILFLSDVRAEIDAARDAGMNAALCVRPGSAEPAPEESFVVRNFNALFSEPGVS